MGKEQLGGRYFGAETAILAGRGDGERRGRRGGAVWTFHLGCVQSAVHRGGGNSCAARRTFRFRARHGTASAPAVAARVDNGRDD